MWQTIDSAPKDRDYFLACAFTDNSQKKMPLHTPEGVHMVGVTDRYLIVQLRWDDEDEDYYDDYGDEHTQDLGKYFTHWMPMPAKPATQSDNQT